MFGRIRGRVVTKEAALPGRSVTMEIDPNHYVSGHSMLPPYPEGAAKAVFGMGCFWGAEQRFWKIPGVFVTAVGYTGGYTPNPTYQEVCSGRTGHAEVVLVVFDPEAIGYTNLLSVFWESHDPTQGARQGNDVGTQYRSCIFAENAEQMTGALASKEAYQNRLKHAGYGEVTTEIRQATEFYFAENYHQQYLAKNPNGYCGLAGTGVSCVL